MCDNPVNKPVKVLEFTLLLLSLTLSGRPRRHKPPPLLKTSPDLWLMGFRLQALLPLNVSSQNSSPP